MRSGISAYRGERPPAILPDCVKRVASAEADFYHGCNPNE